MNFLVIGHSVVDKIYLGENISVRPGGIFYTVIALNSFLQAEDKLFLCTTVDKLNYSLFSSAYEEVEKEYVRFKDMITMVHLRVKNSGEREEKYENHPENLNIDFTQLNRFNGILVNMITGFDLSVEQIQRLRKSYSGLIYFDVHTLSRGLNDNYSRKFRQIPDFYKWAGCIDILQVNESELKTLSSKIYEPEIVEELMNYGIKQVIVTRGPEGAGIYIKEKDEVEFINQKALQTEPVNCIGCGDVFGAVYFYSYIRNKNADQALLLANTAAGISTEYKESGEYIKLKEDVRKRLNKT